MTHDDDGPDFEELRHQREQDQDLDGHAADRAAERETRQGD